MKIMAFILSLLSFPCFAYLELDLTDPENLEIADGYPLYEVLQLVSFEDTIGSEASGHSFFALKTKKNNKNWDVVFAASISVSKGGVQKVYIKLNSKCFEHPSSTLLPQKPPFSETGRSSNQALIANRPEKSCSGTAML